MVGETRVVESHHVSSYLCQVEAVPLEAALGEVTELARQLDLSAHDAACLSPAARRGLALSTVDDRLTQACERAGVKLMA